MRKLFEKYAKYLTVIIPYAVFIAAGIVAITSGSWLGAVICAAAIVGFTIFLIIKSK